LYASERGAIPVQPLLALLLADRDTQPCLEYLGQVEFEAFCAIEQLAVDAEIGRLFFACDAARCRCG